MYRKLCLIFPFCVFLVPHSFSGELFVGFGGGERWADGTGHYRIKYISPINTPEHQVGDVYYETFAFDVTDEVGFGWNSSLMPRGSFEIGYRLSDRIAIRTTVDQYFHKNSERSQMPRLNPESPGLDDPIVFERSFAKRSLITAVEYRLGKRVFVTTGLEVGYIKVICEQSAGLDGNGGPFYNSGSDLYSGWLAGLGYEHGVGQKLNLVVIGAYSLSEYTGDDLAWSSSMDNVKLDLGGFDLQLALRFYPGR